MDHLPLLSQANWQGAALEMEQSEYEMTPVWDIAVVGSVLTCFATVQFPWPLHRQEMNFTESLLR